MINFFVGQRERHNISPGNGRTFDIPLISPKLINSPFVENWWVVVCYDITNDMIILFVGIDVMEMKYRFRIISDNYFSWTFIHDIELCLHNRTHIRVEITFVINTFSSGHHSKQSLRGFPFGVQVANLKPFTTNGCSKNIM